MAAFTDVGMEITVISQVIENICHQVRFDAAERDLAHIVSVASEICDCQHVMSPYEVRFLLRLLLRPREKLPFALNGRWPWHFFSIIGFGHYKDTANGKYGRETEGNLWSE
jgi:hypothetical protein